MNGQNNWKVTWETMLGFVLAIVANAPWVVFVLVALLGGFAAHMRWYESVADASHWTCIRKLWSRVTISAFIGLMIYFAAQGIGYDAHPTAKLICGIFGFYGIKAIDFIWEALTEAIRTQLNSNRRAD